MTPFMKCTLLILLTGWLAGCGKGPTPLRTLDGPWAFRADPSDVGSKENWARQTNDTVTWKTIKVPGAWEDLAPLANYDGIGWYRSTFSAVGIGEPWSLLFEGVDDDAVVWLNGTEIGSHVGYSDPFVVDAAGAAIPGENSLVVRVVDHSGPRGIFRPVRIIRTAEKEGYLRSSLAERPARRSEEWVRNAVIYEVYLRSFSKDGSFSAVEARLQELKDLGVTVLWFMPIHPVGELNRKGSLGSPYAVRDFYGFNFEFGSGEDFRSLVSSAHRMGMKVIIDLVANHTAWDSPMLLDHPEWYTSNDDGAIVAPNQDWSDVADLNYDRHELRKYMVAMMRHWVKEYDIDGFRCDVAEMVPTDFWETARRELERVKPVLMLSEGTLPEHHLNAFDLTYAWTVYDVLDPILRGQSPASIISETIQREAYRFPQGSLRLRFNTNHDKNAWDAPAVEKFGHDGALLSAALVFTLPGVPLIYNGEEVGNPQRLSLFEKVAIDWSTGREFRELYTELATLRRSLPWLSTGSYEPIDHNGGSSVLAFARHPWGQAGKVVGVFNFSETPVSMALPESLAQEGAWRTRLGGTGTPDLRDLRLSARGFVILELLP